MTWKNAMPLRRHRANQTKNQYQVVKLIYSVIRCVSKPAKAHGTLQQIHIIFHTHHIPQLLLGNTNDTSQRTRQVITHGQCPYASRRERTSHLVQCSTKPTLLHDQSPRNSTHVELLPLHRRCPKPTMVGVDYNFSERSTACLEECTHNSPAMFRCLQERTRSTLHAVHSTQRQCSTFLRCQTNAPTGDYAADVLSVSSAGTYCQRQQGSRS